MNLSSDLSKYQHVYTNRQREALEIFYNVENMAEAAEKLGIDRRAAYTLLQRIKDAAEGAGHTEVPLSEDVKKFHEEWGADECIEELRRIAEIDTTRVVSRNYFRNNSDISESTWNRYFGTFNEFKRQAGVTLTRQQHALERHIAKHVSVDHYKDLDGRHDWGDKYRRENSNRFKSMLVGSDFHDKECDPFFLRVFLDTAERMQPDDIVLGGDIFDLAEFGKYDVDPREWDAVGRIRFAHDNILEPLREACPDANIDLIEGNHECIEQETEVLTDTGWLKAKDVTTSSKIASYTLDGGSVSYDTPIALKSITDSKLISVTGDFSKEVISDAHRINVDQELQSVKDFVGSSIKNSRMRYAINTGGVGIDLSDDEIRLLTWVVCDGTIVSRQLTNKRVQFKLSKPRKIERLKKLLDSMGVEYTFRKATKSGSNKLQPYYICIYSDDARHIFNLLNGEKQFPLAWSTQLSNTQLCAILEELEHTDGMRHYNKISWRTTSKHDVDVIQMACILNGTPCYFTENGKSGFVQNGKLQYSVQIADRGVCAMRTITIKDMEETGTVIAIQTTNGTLITRRDGKVNFTGNCRLLRQLSDTSPALRAVLSDLMGITVGKLLGLDDFEINYISKADLRAFTQRDFKAEVAKNYKVYYDSYMVHHFPYARNNGIPGANGHHHRHAMWGFYNHTYGPYEWHQLGAGHKRDASYCEGENWHNGFAIVHIDTHTSAVNTEYVPVTTHAVVGGEWYLREPGEVV